MRWGLRVGTALVAGFVVLALVGPLVTSDPLRLDIDRGLTELGAPRGPGTGLLGTDPLGRDVWARIVAGAGTSLWIASAATALAVLAGVVIGLVAGYHGGRVDAILMRSVDLALAFPVLLLAILLAALLRERGGTGSFSVIVPLAFVGWTTFARVVRAQTRSLMHNDYVLAARCLGASATRTLLAHVLPNIASLIAVLAAFAFAQNLLAESVLSFLGLGPPPPAPSWGRMLYEGRAYYRTNPHLVIAPGLAIVLAVVAFHLVAAGLRPREARG